jgi:hypothetical protein
MAETEYTPEALQACEKALRTILTKIGTWGQEVYLIGGLVPRYLVGDPQGDSAPHVGTTDLDLVIGITITTEDREVYKTLQANLKHAHFAPARSQVTGNELSFCWTREVDGFHVFLEFFCPVGDGKPGEIYRNPETSTTENIGSKISAIRTHGAELVAMDFLTVTLKGELLDHGGIQEGVAARVANLLPFLVLKALALEGRDKDKDGYDIVWTLASFPGGVESVLERIGQSPALSQPAVQEAIASLRKNFISESHRGPAQYARFLQSSNDEDQRLRLRRYAFGTVRNFLERWEAHGW